MTKTTKASDSAEAAVSRINETVPAPHQADSPGEVAGRLSGDAPARNPTEADVPTQRLPKVDKD